LLIEYQFLNTAAIALGYALAKSPDFSYKERISKLLTDLTIDQKKYFIKISDKIGFSLEKNISDKSKQLSKGLHNHFRNTSMTEDFYEIIVCMLGAEWLYLTWCSKASSLGKLTSPMKEWIIMHSEGNFVNNVKWLKEEINNVAAQFTDGRKNKLQHIFNTTLKEEIKFHNAPYHT